MLFPKGTPLNTAARERYLRALDGTRDAGNLALSFFDRPLEVEWKENQSPVTIADKKAEELLKSRLLGFFPNDSFLGEESSEVKGTSGFRWIVDPVDGTRSFVRGVPLWGTLVGLEYQGDPVAGVCYIPAFGKDGLMYRGLRGDGAYREDRRIHVSDIKSLEKSQFFFSSLSWFMQSKVLAGFSELITRTERQRGFGDFYGFMLVAQGGGEAMVEYGVSPWDVAALVPILEEAGGKYTDWNGNRTIFRPDVLASNGQNHDEILAILKKGVGTNFDPAVVENSKAIT